MPSPPKRYFSTGYVEVNTRELSNAGCYVLEDGRPFFDFVCIFAANLGWDSRTQRSVLIFNPRVDHLMNHTNQVHQLREQGIHVLLSILNNHDQAGWSRFQTEDDARQFVQQLVGCVDTYGLAGIDIDDEYSDGRRNPSSLAMVTTLMREAMPDKIISKALWSDYDDFRESWNGRRLSDNLNYGWEMSYGGDPQWRIQPYLDAGMTAGQLAVGVTLPYGGDVKRVADYTVQKPLGGMMAFNVDTRSADQLSIASQILYRQATRAKPGCLTAPTPADPSAPDA